MSKSFWQPESHKKPAGLTAEPPRRWRGSGREGWAETLEQGLTFILVEVHHGRCEVAERDGWRGHGEEHIRFHSRVLKNAHFCLNNQPKDLWVFFFIMSDTFP